MLADDGYGLLSIAEVKPSQLTLFDCGKTHLNEFLDGIALPMHEKRLGLTNVVFHKDYDGVVGYFTLSNDAIPLKDSEKFDLGLNMEVSFTAFPAVKIGRFAVAKCLQGSGVGSAILEIVKGSILDSTSLSSSRLIVVDADNDEKVIRFYKKHGFQKSLWAESSERNDSGRNKRPTTVKMLCDIIPT